MGRKPNYYNLIIDVLKELHAKYPSFDMGRHIATALDGYQDYWGIPDKELYFALKKYSIQLELDETPITEGKQLQKVIDDAMDLTNLLNKDEEDDY